MERLAPATKKIERNPYAAFPVLAANAAGPDIPADVPASTMAPNTAISMVVKTFLLKFMPAIEMPIW